VTGIYPGTAIITYAVTNSCTTLSATKLVTIYPKLIPSVSINSLSGDTVCIDKDYSASSTIVNGGSSPKYKWQVNGNGSDTGSSYTYHPNNNDMVSVLLTSNAICAIPATAIATQVVNTLAPSINIITANNNKIGIGESDTLIAQLENAGKNPTYQWLINDQAVAGETHPIFVTNKLVSNDQVSCQVTCSDICGGTTIQGSLSVNVLPFHEGDVVLSPNPNKGVFTLEGLFETNITKVAIDIKDVLGRSTFSATIPTSSGYFKQMITLAHLSKGMYILTLNAGGVNMVKKFVVE
jgi:hypothetical protein